MQCMIEEAYSALKRWVVETWTLKVIVLSAQMEMSIMLLETRGKMILVIKWQRIWLNCFCWVERRTC